VCFAAETAYYCIKFSEFYKRESVHRARSVSKENLIFTLFPKQDNLSSNRCTKISDLITLFLLIEWGNKVDGYGMPLATEVVSSEK